MNYPRSMRTYLYFYRRTYRYCLLAFLVVIAFISFANAEPAYPSQDCSSSGIYSNMAFDEAENKFEYSTTNSYLMGCVDNLGLKYKSSAPTDNIIKKHIKIGTVKLVVGSLINGARRPSSSDLSVLNDAKTFGSRVKENCAKDSAPNASDDSAAKFIDLCQEISRWASMNINTAASTESFYSDPNNLTPSELANKCNKSPYDLKACVLVLIGQNQNARSRADAEERIGSSHNNGGAGTLARTCLTSIKNESEFDNSEACKLLCANPNAHCDGAVAASGVEPPAAPAPEDGSSGPPIADGQIGGDPGDATGTGEDAPAGADDSTAKLEDVAENVGQKMFGGGGSAPIAVRPTTGGTRTGNANSKYNLSSNMRSAKGGSQSQELNYPQATSFPLAASMPARFPFVPPGGASKEKGAAGGNPAARPSPVGSAASATNGQAGATPAAKRPGGGRAPSEKPAIGSDAPFMDTAGGKSPGVEPQETLDKRIKDKIAENKEKDPIDRDRVNAAYQRGMNRAGAVAGDEFFPAAFFPPVDSQFQSLQNGKDILTNDGHSF